MKYKLPIRHFTFLAFHPKALNDGIDLAGLLACACPAHLPIRLSEQWFGVLPFFFPTRRTGIRGMPVGRVALTATGIAPDLHRTSLLMTQGVNQDRCKTKLKYRTLPFDTKETGKMKRLKNIHPGEILREEFLLPLNITAYRLSKDTGIPQTRVSQIIKGNRRITAGTALRLSKYFGTTAKFWLGLQDDFDFISIY